VGHVPIMEESLAGSRVGVCNFALLTVAARGFSHHVPLFPLRKLSITLAGRVLRIAITGIFLTSAPPDLYVP
jgi:hypothetical protein